MAPEAQGEDLIRRASTLMRKHEWPRRTGVTPAECDEPPPVKLDDIDTTRVTMTSLRTADEARVEDMWDGQLSGERVGGARFDIIRCDVPPGYTYYQGRTTRTTNDLWAGTCFAGESGLDAQDTKGEGPSGRDVSQETVRLHVR